MTLSARAPVKREPWLRWEWWLLAAVTLLGAILRLYRLDVLPPGVHYDEAVYGLQGQYIYQGHFPVFFQGYTGREPFYMYLVALVYLFTGPTTFGLRLTSALIGILTIPAGYLALRELFDRRVALLAAFLTATSFWHFNVTRTGFCWTLMPLIECLAVYFLWRGYQRRERWALLLGGAFTASMLYIYLAARFFPFAVVLMLVYLLIVDRAGLRAQWRRLVLAAAVAVAVFFPLGLHYVRVPHDFWERADQVLSFKQGESLAQVVGRNAARMVLTFLPRPDGASSFNLQGRPAFDWLIGPFFVLGAVLCLARWRKPAYGLLFLWFLVMACPPLPTVEPYPVSQRIFGTIPALYGVAALGLAAVWRWAEQRGIWRVAAPVALGVVLAAEAGWSAYYYFARWAPSQQTYYQFHSDVVDAARLVRPEMEAGHQVVIASEHYHHPSAVITDPITVDAKWAQGKQMVVLPAWDGREIDYIIPIFDARPIAEAMQVLQTVACSKDEVRASIGDPVVEVYRICRPPAQPQGKPLATLAGEVALWSVDVPAGAPRDQKLRIGLHWSVLKAVDQPRLFSVHLVDAQGVRWAQADQLGYLSPEWRAGDQVWQWLDVELPASTPPGAYQVRVLLSGDNAQPLPVRDAAGTLAGVYVTAGTVNLTSAGPSIGKLQPAAASLGTLRVVAHAPVDAGLHPGDKVATDVTWQLAEPEGAAVSAAFELRAEDGHTAATWSFPLAPDYPVSAWQAGETVRQRTPLPLPGDLANGSYTLWLGTEGHPAALNLGKVRVAGVARSFAVPQMQHPLAEPLKLGGKLELLGYDLEKDAVRGTDPVRLTLYWRAIAPMEADYTVFVHLLDGRGEIAAQQDIGPAEGARPTGGWQVGEVVADTHVLPASAKRTPGTYRLALGAYDPQTLVRLEMRAATGERVPDDRYELATVTVQP